MSDDLDLLNKIEEGLVAHGGDLGGWTKVEAESLKIFDGRVSLKVDLADLEGSLAVDQVVHAHVFATLHEHDDAVLDACVMGLGEDRNSAIAEAALIWITGVAGPIRSFLDNKPVCMTCQAGSLNAEPEQGYVSGGYGLSGLRAFVGPAFARGFDTGDYQDDMSDSMPWFRYAAESAAPRRIHLAKATIRAVDPSEGGSWHRQLEVDGHEVAHQDADWPASKESPESGYMIRYTVFEFPRNSTAIAQRAKLDETIACFIKEFGNHQTLDDLKAAVSAKGFSPEMVHDVSYYSTLAFGRWYFEQLGVTFSSYVIRAKGDGEVQADLKLASVPAFSRALAVAGKMLPEMDDQYVQNLCCFSPEADGVVQALEANPNLDVTTISLFPGVVADYQADDKTLENAMTVRQSIVDSVMGSAQASKPWWKFW